LILSLLGIAALTLFPYHFDFSHRSQYRPSFLLLRTVPKPGSGIDFFLNILLFIPFGFGVALKARKRGAGPWTSLMVALAVGALVSYAVEFLQLFVPSRDSSWDDVLANAAGSLTGGILFEFCGVFFVELATKIEDRLENWTSPLHTALLLALYFAVWFGISIILQEQTRLSNWDLRCTLDVGGDATGENPWKGRVYLLQIWDRVLPDNQIVRGLGLGPAPSGDTGSLVSYDLSGLPPFADRRDFLPPLVWAGSSPLVQVDPQSEQGAGVRLTTASPVGGMIAAIKKTNQFTVRVVCAPAEVIGRGGRIVSLSQSQENVDFQLRQAGGNLLFWFRNPLSAIRASLVWRADNVFETGKTREIVASYDGSNAFLYVDGKKAARVYRLGPGASLVHKISSVRFEDLDGYVILYEGLVFLPAGVLFGIAARRWYGMKASERWILSAFLLLPPTLLEFLLVWVSGRRIWPENIVFSTLFGFAAILWINSDFAAERK
jgi:VanZ family protein